MPAPTISHIICSMALIVLIFVMQFSYFYIIENVQIEMMRRELKEVSDYVAHTLENLYFLVNSTQTAGIGGNDLEHVVDNNTSDVDGSPSKGSHSSFANQQFGPDSIYDTLTEENTGGSDETTYDFTSGGESNKWFYGTGDCGQTPPSSPPVGSEITTYSEIAESDNIRYGTSYSSNDYPCHNWKFTITEDEGTINAIYVYVEGYGTDLDGADYVFYIWDSDANSWVTVGTATSESSDNVIYASYTSNFLRFIDANEYLYLASECRAGSKGSSGGTFYTDFVKVVVVTYSTPNYELDLEVQWTNTDFDEANEELCIYAGATDAENIRVDAWNTATSTWNNVFTDLTANSWNNVSVTEYLGASTFTIRFKGGVEAGDTSRNSWRIDMTLLHLSTQADPNYVSLEKELNLPLTIKNSIYVVEIVRNGNNASGVSVFLKDRSFIRTSSWLIQGLKIGALDHVESNWNGIVAGCRREGAGVYVWISSE